MNNLRLEFEESKKSDYSGAELMFETSNLKYIEWLEQRLVKNCDINTNSLKCDCKHSGTCRYEDVVIETKELCRHKE